VFWSVHNEKKFMIFFTDLAPWPIPCNISQKGCEPQLDLGAKDVYEVSL
jgi:hypothetical protein